jgi:NAD(P)-dependent dehydrogenase (short-subunit alcohol dehydrogenase family)
MTLKGKYILITGSARRIGRHLALAVAKAGGNIILHHAHSPVEAEKTSREIKKLGVNVIVIEADLNDPISITKILPDYIKEHNIYALVNSAAIFESLSLEDVTLENWNRHLNINLTAPFFLSQAFIRAIPPGSTGRIINIVDWRALRPGSDHLPYTISKSALIALTHSLAVSAAPNITVNALALGAVLPPSDGGSAEKMLHLVPSRRLVELDEVSDSLLFLLDGPSSITGEVIQIDGGRHLL